MPKTWLYFFALFLPIVGWALLIHTGVVNWLWYQGYTEYYYLLAGLREQEHFMGTFGSWAFPVFVITVCSFWNLEDDADIGKHFMLLPVAYVPFAWVAHVLSNGEFTREIFYAYPLIIIPFGYAYVVPWAASIWVFDKLRIVM